MERLGIGVVCVVEDGEATLLDHLATPTGKREPGERLNRIVKWDGQLTCHGQGEHRIAGLMRSPRGDRELPPPEPDPRSTLRVECDRFRMKIGAGQPRGHHLAGTM